MRRVLWSLPVALVAGPACAQQTPPDPVAAMGTAAQLAQTQIFAMIQAASPVLMTVLGAVVGINVVWFLLRKVSGGGN